MAWKVIDASGRTKGSVAAYGWNVLSASGSGLTLLDHGALSGLADDDHTQYLLNNGTRTGAILAVGSGDFVQIGGGASASTIRFMEPSGSGTNYTAFKAQAQTANVTYTLPAADGSANQLLSTNGSGTLSWATAASGGFSAPQGRLTLVTGTPVMSSEQAAKTTIYYTPYQGDKIPLYDGSAWSMTTFTELSLAMASSANWAANSNYDLYVYNDGGTLRFGTGAAWTSDTARNESLTMLNGIYVNAATMTLRYGASSTVSAAANRATYVGTMRTTANTGETTWELGGDAAGGDAINLYLWNCYNRVLTSARTGDTTASWTTSSTALESKNASTLNRASFVVGLNEDVIAFRDYTHQYHTSTLYSRTAIGLDSTSARAAGSTHQYLYGESGNNTNSGVASFVGLAGLGFHYLQVLQAASNVTAAATYLGTDGQSSAQFEGRF